MENLFLGCHSLTKTTLFRQTYENIEDLKNDLEKYKKINKNNGKEVYVIETKYAKEMGYTDLIGDFAVVVLNNVNKEERLWEDDVSDYFLDIYPSLKFTKEIVQDIISDIN